VLLTIIANCVVLALEEHLPCKDKTILAQKLVSAHLFSEKLEMELRCVQRNEPLKFFEVFTTVTMKMPSFGMWRSVAAVTTDISE
jgi:hypothetical protein